MWRISESGRLIGVDEESLIRREERISRKMYRLYGLIKKQPDRSRRTIRELYQNSFEGKSTYAWMLLTRFCLRTPTGKARVPRVQNDGIGNDSSATVKLLDEAAILQLLEQTVVIEVLGVGRCRLGIVRKRENRADRLLGYVGNLQKQIGEALIGVVDHLGILGSEEIGDGFFRNFGLLVDDFD